MLLLDALELDQKNGGDGVERYLFDNLANPFWPSSDIRQNALLISHKFQNVGDVRGDANDERTADMFHAAVIGRFNTNKRDVLNLFKSAVEGKFSNNGASFSEEGQFVMAHILSMLMNEQSTLEGFKPKSYIDEFGDFIRGKGQGWFGGINYESFGKFVGSIGQSELAGAEIMTSLERYLRSKGSSALLADPGSAGGILGTMIDFVRDEARDRNAKAKQLFEFLIGASIAVGVAAYGPIVLGAAVAKEAVAGIVELAKSTAKFTSKFASEYATSALRSSDKLEADMQILFALNIFPALAEATKVEMAKDAYLKPFISVNQAAREWTISMPKVGCQFFDGKTTRTFEAPDLILFMNRVSRFVPPTSEPVVLFSDAFFLRLRGEG
jgi:hypothetical protein